MFQRCRVFVIRCGAFLVLLTLPTLATTARCQFRAVSLYEAFAVDTSRPAAKILSFADAAANSVYLELGGNALLYSINYDRKLLDYLAFHVGLGVFPVGKSEAVYASENSYYDHDEESTPRTFLAIPIEVSYLFHSTRKGIGASNVELGVGGTYIKVHGAIPGFDLDINQFIPTVLFGYRYQPAIGGFNWRLFCNFTSLPARTRMSFESNTEGVDYIHEGGPTVWGGMSFGYTF